VLLLVGVSALAPGCDRGGQPAEQRTPEPAAQPDGAARADEGTSPDAHEGAHDAAGGAAGHAHGGTGEPRPLLPIMQQLGTDMVTLTHALMTDSAELVAHAAESIANHPPIAQDEIERIHRTLGDQMHEFERLDEEVHGLSVQLHEAAEAGDTEEVLTLLNQVQRGCVACHTQFRERLRTKTAG
jgi:hypothetical protein